jgi:3-oxoacyl-[acyl-carrier-protein] synthase II
MCAAKQALDDASWRPESYEDQTSTGVLIGSGIGGIEGIADMAVVLHEKGPRRVSPFFIPGRIINLASGFVSIAFGLKGPCHAVVTACSTGAHAIGDAARMVALGDAEVMVAGGTESPVNRMALAGFAALRALSTGFNDTPKRASRPTTRIAMVLSWARAPVPWFWNRSSMRRRAAPRFTRNSPATDFRATLITSPHPRRTAMAPFAA